MMPAKPSTHAMIFFGVSFSRRNMSAEISTEKKALVPERTVPLTPLVLLRPT